MASASTSKPISLTAAEADRFGLNLDLPRRELFERLQSAVATVRAEGAPLKLYRFGFVRLSFVDRNIEGPHLHVWSDTLARDEAPHIHNCHIASRVLLGGLTNFEWSDPIDDAAGVYRKVQTICSDTVCEDIVSDERVRVDPVSESHHHADRANHSYAIPQGQFHSTLVDPGLTMTLIHKTGFVPETDIINLMPFDQPPRTGPFDITAHDQQVAWALVDEAFNQLA